MFKAPKKTKQKSRSLVHLIHRTQTSSTPSATNNTAINPKRCNAINRKTHKYRRRIQSMNFKLNFIKKKHIFFSSFPNAKANKMKCARMGVGVWLNIQHGNENKERI